ncbi:CGNR zinc finger domain-containing protein [Arthrobacter sp. NPDC058097]|uniref:CGNR zinc finger domain-containing protein n=1 Tax=Arthrobacter sp. NPDC058097 TaxID=3346340 RepID=UPI0036D983BA
MQFNHDNMHGVRLAESLVNMLADGMWGSDSLEDLLASHLFRSPRVTATNQDELRAWAIRLQTVFAAEDQEARCSAVNALLAQGVRRVFLTTHDDMLPHLHFADASETLVERVRAVTAGGLAIFMTEAAGERLGVCAWRDCSRVFADTSRGGNRAYCSARCGNADAVRRYRGRARSG